MEGKHVLRIIEGALAVAGHSAEVEVLKLTVKALRDKKIDRNEFREILGALEACVAD